MLGIRDRMPIKRLRLPPLRSATRSASEASNSAKGGPQARARVQVIKRKTCQWPASMQRARPCLAREEATRVSAAGRGWAEVVASFWPFGDEAAFPFFSSRSG